MSHQLEAFMAGWATAVTDGKYRMPGRFAQGDPDPDWQRGYAAGRAAYEQAEQTERERLEKAAQSERERREQCPKCCGKKTVFEWLAGMWEWSRVERPCPACHGSGQRTP